MQLFAVGVKDFLIGGSDSPRAHASGVMKG